MENDPPSVTTEGWLALDEDGANGRLQWQQFVLRPLEDTDVDIQVTHCGICGTDVHAIKNSWNMTTYPCCPGHEIVGIVTQVGNKVHALKPGDRAGVGPQGFACHESDCQACGRGFEMRCPKFVPSYNGVWHDGKSIHHGGLAKLHRANASMAFKIPDGLASEYAAPMLCAGITSWAPLRRHGAGPGKSVGILGIGGIGHFALLWAKALGCDSVVAINRTSAKKQDCLSLMGADAFIAMADDGAWDTEHSQTLDLILSTSDSGDMPMGKLLGLLKLGGTFVTVGASADPLQNLNTFALCSGMAKLEGSFWGTRQEMEEMMAFASKHDIRPLIQVYPAAKANDVIVGQKDGKARYKYVVDMQ